MPQMASGEITNGPLLLQLARSHKPIILSTGMCTMDEVKRAVAVIHGAGNRQLILLQCTTNYPSPTADANLRAMVTMRDALGVLLAHAVRRHERLQIAEGRTLDGFRPVQARAKPVAEPGGAVS